MEQTCCYCGSSPPPPPRRSAPRFHAPGRSERAPDPRLAPHPRQPPARPGRLHSPRSPHRRAEAPAESRDPAAEAPVRRRPFCRGPALTMAPAGERRQPRRRARKETRHHPGTGSNALPGTGRPHRPPPHRACAGRPALDARPAGYRYRMPRSPAGVNAFIGSTWLRGSSTRLPLLQISVRTTSALTQPRR